MLKFLRNLFTTYGVFIGMFTANAAYTFELGGTFYAGIGSNDFAPFYIHSNNHGKITQSKNLWLDVWAQDTLDLSKRFDFAWGAEFLTGVSNKVDYWQWNPAANEFRPNPQGPANIWLQQLYGAVKWRSLFLSAGLKDWDSSFVDQTLSSGDLLWSGNSRGIPEIRIGFVDFQYIPLTKKFLQIDAVLSYGKFVDTKWIDHHFDYWYGKTNPGAFWTYKRLALRSNPENRFLLQIGIQMTGIFGGKTFRYGDGELKSIVDNYTGFKDFFYMLLPLSYGGNGEGYRVGDHKGTWDIAARYIFKNGMKLRAYTQWLWEDSSGIAKQNGWDGLWGLEFKMGRKWWINGVVAEYLDLTHMSGPLGFDPSHSNGTLPYKADGGDGYYNNFYYRSYVNYGLNMGTPMVQGILFNTGENQDILFNDEIPYFRVRGFHIAVTGNILDNLEYIVKYNHRKAWGGTNRYTLIRPAESDSFYIGAKYSVERVQGLTIDACLGFDKGNLPSNSVGGMLSATYILPIIFK